MYSIKNSEFTTNGFNTHSYGNMATTGKEWRQCVQQRKPEAGPVAQFLFGVQGKG
jgi:hypothetical protein